MEEFWNQAMATQRDWLDFCRRAASTMRAALENKIALKEASNFFDGDNTITDPDLRRYVEYMVWEIGGSPGSYMELLEMFEARHTEEQFVRYLGPRKASKGHHWPWN